MIEKNRPIPGNNKNIRVMPPVIPNAILMPFRIFSFCGSIEDIPQGKDTKQRDTEFCNNKCHGNCPEFVVSGEKIKKNIGERHEVLPPCQHNRQYCCRKQPPFFRSFNNYQSKDKQEEYNSSHINRTVYPRLRAPVFLKLFKVLSGIVFSQCRSSFELLSKGWHAPPLKFGMKRVRVSSTP